MLTRSFFERDTHTVAKALLGCVLHFEGKCLRIVETEAYGGADDPGSHAHRGPTQRSEVMFGKAGHAYIYMTYGMHHCFNIVTAQEGVPGAVLLRGAIVPENGQSTKVQHIDGPGRFTKYFGLTRAQNRIDLTANTSFFLMPGSLHAHEKMLQTTRIGLSKGAALPWRYVIQEFNTKKQAQVYDHGDGEKE